MDLERCTVYIHRNIVNNKCYIGITCQNVNKRWQKGCGYLNKYKDGSYVQPKMARAIKKYGWDSFEHIIWAEGLTYKDACRLEIMLIALWDTVENGYNVTPGGPSVMYGRKHSEKSRRKMSEALKGVNHPRARRINQYTKDGQLIKTWDYVTQAANELNISKNSIAECCNHPEKRKSAGGFTWQYYDNSRQFIIQN